MFCRGLEPARDASLGVHAQRFAPELVHALDALFAGHDEGGRTWARIASVIETCKLNGVEPYAYLCDLFTRLANGHLARDIDDLMPWAYAARIKASQ